MSREEQVQQILESISRLQRSIPPATWEKSGLSRAQAGLLYMLYHKQSASMKELAEHLFISRSAVTQLTEPLLEKKLVVREVDERDRRAARLKLTDKGRSAVHKLGRHKLLALQSALETLSDTDLATLSSLYSKMTLNKK